MKRKKGIQDEIARVAYELYKERGRVHGHDLEDWLEAEKIVMEKHERHAREMAQQADVIKKPREGFRRTFL